MTSQLVEKDLSAAGERKPQFALKLAIFLALVKLTVHIFFNWLAPHLGYGFFRDELYFIVCGRRLAWGYVDQAPMVALQARICEVVFGTSLVAFRMLSAFAGCLTIILTGLLTWAMGGTRLAQGISMTVVLLWPFYLGFDGYLSMNSFEPVFWMTFVLSIILMANGADRRLWLLAGLAFGLGLENKQDILFFAAAVVVGMCLSGQQYLLWNRWAAIALIVAVLLGLPNVLWQMNNHWPTWQFLHNPARPIIHHHILGFIRQQLFLLNVTLLFAGAGMLWLLFRHRNGIFRFVAFGYLVFFVVMFLLHARTYYLAPYYPVLIGAGSIALVDWTQWNRWMLKVALCVVLAYDLAYAPTAIPMMRPAPYLAYRNRLLRLTNPGAGLQSDDLEQWYSDRIGWNTVVADVVGVYRDLPPADRSKTALLSHFYGDASAIDVLGQQYGLPQAISGSQNFWLWGPQDYDGSSVIAVGYLRSEIPPVFQSVTQVGFIRQRFATAYEARPIFLCKGMSPPLQQYWPKLKRWM